MEPAQTFLNFLEDHNIENVSKISDNIMDLVSDNYDALDQETMRAMVDCALAERDVNVAIGGQENDLLGSWGVIIDTFKEQTMLRRERAGNNLQQLVAFGLQSTGGSAVQTFIDSIRQKGQVDSVLIDLVESSLADVDKYPGNDGIKSVLRDVFLRIKPTATVSISAQVHTAKAGDISNKDDISEEDLLAAGDLLRQMIGRNSGDASKLKAEVTQRLQGAGVGSSFGNDTLVSLTGTAFQKVLNDNIVACRNVGYANKTKLLEFLKQTIDTIDASSKRDVGDSSDNDGDKANVSSDHINHAPKFVDDSRSDIKVSLVEEDDYIDIANASEALSISATGAKPDKQAGSINNKKKSLKSANKKRVADTASTIGAHLEEHGWAVCDHALPMDLVKRVRVEAGLFTDFYEQSEIWVGKKSDIGAQLSVPSVRGYVFVLLVKCYVFLLSPLHTRQNYAIGIRCYGCVVATKRLKVSLVM